MISIVKPTIQDAGLLAAIARQSFIESHGHSASGDDIHDYINANYREEQLKAALEDPRNNYYFIHYNQQLAGFSNIIFNEPCPGSGIDHLAKFDRIYLLQRFYGLKIGEKLFDFNYTLAKENGQNGLWLYVWTENLRAVNFYKRRGFSIIGHHDFKISEKHSNPNYRMLLLF